MSNCSNFIVIRKGFDICPRCGEWKLGIDFHPINDSTHFCFHCETRFKKIIDEDETKKN